MQSGHALDVLHFRRGSWKRGEPLIRRGHWPQVWLTTGHNDVVVERAQTTVMGPSFGMRESGMRESGRPCNPPWSMAGMLYAGRRSSAACDRVGHPERCIPEGHRQHRIGKKQKEKNEGANGRSVTPSRQDGDEMKSFPNPALQSASPIGYLRSPPSFPAAAWR